MESNWLSSRQIRYQSDLDAALFTLHNDSLTLAKEGRELTLKIEGMLNLEKEILEVALGQLAEYYISEIRIDRRAVERALDGFIKLASDQRLRLAKELREANLSAHRWLAGCFFVGACGMSINRALKIASLLQAEHLEFVELQALEDIVTTLPPWLPIERFISFLEFLLEDEEHQLGENFLAFEARCSGFDTALLAAEFAKSGVGIFGNYGLSFSGELLALYSHMKILGEDALALSMSKLENLAYTEELPERLPRELKFKVLQTIADGELESSSRERDITAVNTLMYAKQGQDTLSHFVFQRLFSDADLEQAVANQKLVKHAGEYTKSQALWRYAYCTLGAARVLEILSTPNKDMGFTATGFVKLINNLKEDTVKEFGIHMAIALESDLDLSGITAR